MKLNRIETILCAIIGCVAGAHMLAEESLEQRTAPNNMFPQWSHDGKKIAFTSDRDGNSDIYVMDADGKDVRRLTDTPATERAPVWSPDGKSITFSSDGAGPSEVYIMNADGSNPVCLTG